jgi:hypothetical protein
VQSKIDEIKVLQNDIKTLETELHAKEAQLDVMEDTDPEKANVQARVDELKDLVAGKQGEILQIAEAIVGAQDTAKVDKLLADNVEKVKEIMRDSTLKRSYFDRKC